MKKILLLTNIYPTTDSNYSGTKVCHYFTKEWVRMGYEVQVVHFESVFPRSYSFAGLLFKSLIQAKTGCVVNVTAPRKPVEYKIENVNVLFMPLKKYIPHSMPSKHVLDEAYMVLNDYLKAKNFTPDIIAGHFPLPQLYYIHRLKADFPLSKTVMVLHSSGKNLKTIYKANCSKYMSTVDVWGFRSIAFRDQFYAEYGKPNRDFLCYSGIPEKYVRNHYRLLAAPVKTYTFLGSLYKLKNVNITLQALAKVFPEGEYRFNVVGSGAELKNLRRLVEKLRISHKVVFWGQVKRDESQQILANTDVFVMVSQHEAFGLVYLEAMAQGCLTIATKGQGFDGIIKDGINGFLCEANNIEALSCVLRRIYNLETEQIQLISQKAMDTAREMTNYNVAKNYIEEVSA